MLKDNDGRNQVIDISRGIAMLLVILGHTMLGITMDAPESKTYNIIWTLQMPLFFIISGYVSKYGKTPVNMKELIGIILKKTISYLYPFIIWTFFVRGFLFRQNYFFNIQWFCFHVDAGYWYLLSLWWISCSYVFSSFLCKRNKSGLKRWIKILLLGLSCIPLIILGLFFGFTFMGVKLTLYYTPFFTLGLVFAELKNLDGANSLRIKNTIVFICVIICTFILCRNKIYYLGDNIFEIVIRIVASVAGCIALLEVIHKINSECNPDNRIFQSLNYIGRNTLSIYLSHYLFLCLIPASNTTSSLSMKGVCFVVINFIITVAFSCLVAMLIDKNEFAQMLLLGKKRIRS